MSFYIIQDESQLSAQFHSEVIKKRSKEKPTIWKPGKTWQQFGRRLWEKRIAGNIWESCKTLQQCQVIRKLKTENSGQYESLVKPTKKTGKTIWKPGGQSFFALVQVGRLQSSNVKSQENNEKQWTVNSKQFTIWKAGGQSCFLIGPAWTSLTSSPLPSYYFSSSASFSGSFSHLF